MNKRTLKNIANVRVKARSELKPEEWQAHKYYYDQSLLECKKDQLERIDARNVTREDFIEKYERPAKPVIIQHLIDDWPAFEKWNIEKLGKKYRNQRFKVGEDDDGRSVKLKLKYFLDYAQHNHDDSPLYLFESSFGEHPKKKRLLDDYFVPDYFSEDLFHIVGEHRRPPYRWWCIGPQRSGTGIHIDPLGTSAWNALIVGRKRWCIFPPSTPRELLKPTSLDSPKNKDEGITWFKVIYPRTKLSSWPKEYACVEVIQHPGEVIFVPGGYWHVVLNMDLTIAVTQNFCSSVNFPSVWARVVRSRPKMSKKFLERLRFRRPDLARLTEKIDVNADTGPRSDSSSSSSSSSSTDSSPDSTDESDTESKQVSKQHYGLDQGDEPVSKKQRVTSMQ